LGAFARLPVLRVYQLVRALERTGDRAFGVAEDRLEAGRHPQRAAHEVPLPQSVLGAADRALEALPRIREGTLGEFLLVDVLHRARKPDGAPVRIPFCEAADQEPAVAPVLVPHSDLVLVGRAALDVALADLARGG